MDEIPTNSVAAYPRNTILYGPPGTGKTYNSISHAVALVEGEAPEVFKGKYSGTEGRERVKQKFEEYTAKGRIAFVTFHQSFGYEDFIEGIKPLPPDGEEESRTGLSYVVADGLFKRMCTEAAFAWVAQKPDSEAGRILEFGEAFDRLLAEAVDARDMGTPIKLMTRSNIEIEIEDITRFGNLLLRHTDGNRTYTVSRERLGRLYEAYPNPQELNNINSQFRSVIGGSNASAYYAVLNKIRDIQTNTLSGSIDAVPHYPGYEDKKAAVQKLRNEDFAQPVQERYVLIVDEINRGNVSAIFGELITLLEDDKRLGGAEALRAKLPYSGENFGVPANLFLIGTMNTADRSVEALDTALRRRFSFVHKGPEYSDLLSENCEGINLKQLLQKINRRLTILIDADHTIGHAWLWGVETLEELQEKFRTKILPLLQEYFYNDFEKLGLVLGKSFFKTTYVTGEEELADFDLGGADSSSYADRVLLELKDTDTLSAGDFIRIYNPRYAEA